MIDNFSKYDLFYVNGCSFTVGGGLEEPAIRNNSVLPKYKEIYGVDWENRTQINWAKRLSNIIGIKCINQATCGGSMERLVRMTYDFLQKNWSKKDKLFLILEYIEPSRADVFYTKEQEYYIVNSNWKGDGDDYIFSQATKEYFNPTIKDLENLELQSIFKDWHSNHYSFNENLLKNDKLILGLYSFCKLHNIKIYLMNRPPYTEFGKYILEEDIIKFTNHNADCSIVNWCTQNKLTITDEIGKYLYNWKDSHPGYFGHIAYAIELAKFLGWNEPIYSDELNRYKFNFTLI